MYNCETEDCIVPWISLAMSTLSLVMCMVAISVMSYYKFYRSFNYTLILYLFTSFLIKGLISMIINTLELLPLGMESSFYSAMMLIGDSMIWYSIWNILLCVAFMTAEIFSMVIFSVELRKAEAPLTIACFTLPLVEVVGIYFPEQEDDFNMCNGILGMAAAGICAIAIAITLICLAYHGLRRCAINNDNEEQHLLYQHTRQKYRNAPKESLSFIIYPAMMLLWLLMYTILVCSAYFSVKFIETLDIFDASTGTVSSIVFFIHMKILGQQKRNVFRNRSHNTPPSHTTQEIDEEQE